MKDNWVLLGFSGGIDSFAAVGLLQAAGYHVTALTLDMRGDSALLEKARLRAGALGIPWRMRSVRERFERAIYMTHRHNIVSVWSDGREVVRR